MLTTGKHRTRRTVRSLVCFDADFVVCTRHSPDASVLARFSLPAWSSVRAWLLRLRAVFDFAPAYLPAADPVLHVSAPVRRGAVADARLGLA